MLDICLSLKLTILPTFGPEIGLAFINQLFRHQYSIFAYDLYLNNIAFTHPQFLTHRFW